jgi:glycosyltransferase involved in cell wall biosynthesis
MLLLEETTDRRDRESDGAASWGTEPPLDTAPETPMSKHVAYTVSVVIPTKNEAQNIGWVLRRMGPVVDEVVIVDGLSDDGTIEVAQRVRPDLVVIRHEVAGKGEAVRAGFAAATGDFVVLMDADCSMDPGEIRVFLDALAAGADMAKGSRFLPGGGTTDMTRLRKAGNAGLVNLANLLLGTSHTELCYGFMAFRRNQLEALDLRATGFEIETEIVVKACRAGLRVVEVPSFEAPRMYGYSNLNTFRDGWRVLRTLVRTRFTWRPPAPSGMTPRVVGEVPDFEDAAQG